MHPRGVHEVSQQWRRRILNNQFLYTVNTCSGHRPHERNDTAERARNGCGELRRPVGRPTIGHANGYAGADNFDGPCGWFAAS